MAAEQTDRTETSNFTHCYYSYEARRSLLFSCTSFGNGHCVCGNVHGVTECLGRYMGSMGEAFVGVSDFLDRDDLEDRMDQTIRSLGLGKFAYHVVRITGVNVGGIHGVSTYPEDWVERYERENYVLCDPVVATAMRSVLPFPWREADDWDSLDEVQARFFAEAHDFGISNGLSIPIHGSKEFALLTVLPDGNSEKATETLWAVRNEIHLLAYHAHHHARKVLIDDVATEALPHLTDREKECLQWAAIGKTSWEISEILNVAETTVQTHIESAKKKLDVSSRQFAIVKAITTGLIEIPNHTALWMPKHS